MYHTLRAETERLIEDHWHSIKLLAIELVHRKELDQDEIDWIINRDERLAGR